MKNIFLSILISLTGFQALASDNYGLGLILGSPTAVSGAYLPDNLISYDAGLSFFDSNYVLIYADRLWHFPGSWKSARDPFLASLTPYVGVGPVLALSQTVRTSNQGLLGTSSGSLGIGARIPLGVEWRAKSPNLGIFVEIVPGIVIVPSTGLLLEAGIGARFYF